MLEGEGNEGGAPRLKTSGADESRLHAFDEGAARQEWIGWDNARQKLPPRPES